VSRTRTPELPADIRGWLFDLDGVLTPTAEVHMQAWATVFDPYLVGVAAYTAADYFAYVDGKPRYDGVRALLESRGIGIPDGDPSDGGARETVCGLGNRKDDAFHLILRRVGVAAYPASVAFLDAVQRRGCRVAVVSSSRNAREILAAASLADRFEVVVDGGYAAAEGLPGKPAPHTFTRAASLLGLDPGQTAVVEDAVSGVRAGRSGQFGLVVGVDRGAGAETLVAEGADMVVSELDQLIDALGDDQVSLQE
jgi:beta-phosphoglucomutase family hydrolase